MRVCSLIFLQGDREHIVE